ncbi:MFS transporter [Nocardioides campestrisoli]|uniref:MFS transporter n=1 Tax=Nocardioides campestrisoli TaxID=2736757 RepID=UPI001C636600|nr:MFS transporter [Nocardioides campestrisoli]
MTTSVAAGAATPTRRTGPIILVLALCGTAVSLMQTLVVPLLPDFPRLLDTSADNASWLVTVTLLTSAVATPILSKLADMYGKRRMIVVSLLALLAGSLLGAASDTLTVLIVARALQGFAPALIPIGISTMRDALPPERIGGAVALMSTTLGIGGAVGLPLSGIIYEAFGWQAVFWGSVAMSLLMIALVLAVVPESTVRAPGAFDWVGAVLMSIALTSLLLAISKGGQWGWTSQWTLLSFVLAVLVFGLWVPWELRTGQPLVDLRTSVRRPVLLTNVASLLAGFAMFANLLVAVQQLQFPEASGVGFGLGVTEAGLAMLPGGLLMIIVSPFSASITRRFGARTTLVAGLSVTGLGYLLRVLLDSNVLELLIGVGVVSVGVAISFAAMPVLIMQSVPITETAAANGLNTVVRALGTSTCSATVAAVLAAGTVTVGGQVFPSEGALHATSWLAAGAAFLGAGVALLIPARIAPAVAPSADPGRGQVAAGEVSAVRRDVVRRGEAGAEVVVRGRVCQADGRPARLAVVSVLERTGRQVDWARADNDGRWSVVLPGAGEYLVICAAEGWAPRSELRHLDPQEPATIQLEERLTVAGVVSRGGWPVEGALVVLTDDSGESVCATRTDEGGHYELDLPPLGRYVLTALDPELGVAESEEVVISAQRRRFHVVMAEAPAATETAAFGASEVASEAMSEVRRARGTASPSS